MILRVLKDISLADIGRVGGKAAGLGELINAGIPVPPGYVLKTDAFEQFKLANQLDVKLSSVLQNLTTDNVTAIAENIKALILAAEIPKPMQVAISKKFTELKFESVSVRSSATAEDSQHTAWAGQLDTYLNISRDSLFEYIKCCWASLYGERALLYVLHNHIDIRQVGMAVIVQKMLNADAAGVGFSVHPLTQEPEMMLIQSSFGLGEAVVSGLVTPDSWVVHKQDFLITDYYIAEKKKALYQNDHGSEWRDLSSNAEKPSLRDAEVKSLAKTLESIETYYGIPMDVEWAVEAGQFYLLQARPITTLDSAYQQHFFDETQAWQRYLKRPLNFFAASMFFYNTLRTVALFTDAKFSAVVLEHGQGLALIYTQEAMGIDFIKQKIYEKFETDPEYVIALLERGVAINHQIESAIATNTLPYNKLEDALDFMSEMLATSVQIPYFLHEVLTAQSTNTAYSERALTLTKALRQYSHYTWVYNDLMGTLAAKRLAELGYDNLQAPLQYITLQDLLADKIDVDAIAKREQAVKVGKKFVLSYDGHCLHAYFVDDTGFLNMRITKSRIAKPSDTVGEFSGTTAYPGYAEGVARIIINASDPNNVFDEGDILVSINSNPTLMPYIEKASAIVTGEGGVACHAAIIAREMKIPCVMSVTDITEKIKSGERIIVDADNQVVKRT